MKQDVKFNVWVLISSIFQGVAGSVCTILGIIFAIMGVANVNKMLKVKELNFFIHQEGIIKLQENLFGKVLGEKYLFLILGLIAAVIGIAILVFSIVELLYVKRYQVVNHRIALIAFSLIPLTLAFCAEIYLLNEYNVLKESLDYIRHIRIGCFVTCGVFSICVILKLLGVLFSKSEEFVSNDNAKYAFEGLKHNKVEQGAQNKVLIRNNMASQNEGVVRNEQQPNVKPQTSGKARTVSRQVKSANGTTPTASRNVVSQPKNNLTNTGVQPIKTTTRSSSTRVTRSSALSDISTQNSISPRQIGTPSSRTSRARPSQVKRCPKCGKTLMPNETKCSICSKNESK